MTRKQLQLGYALDLLEQLNDLKIKFNLNLISPKKYNHELENIKKDMTAL